jgi:hypothetical protein
MNMFEAVLAAGFLAFITGAAAQAPSDSPFGA